MRSFIADTTPIVLDSGSFLQRAGFSGDDAPRGSSRAFVGTANPQLLFRAATDSSSSSSADASRVKMDHQYVGSYAEEERINRFLDLQRPMDTLGMIQDWDSMETVWEHVVKDGVSRGNGKIFEESPVMFCDSTANLGAGSPELFSAGSSSSSSSSSSSYSSPDEFKRRCRRQREKIMTVFFERFGVPAFYSAPTGPLAIYSVGRNTAFLVEVGFGKASITATDIGHSFDDACCVRLGGGADMASELLNMLQAKQPSLWGQQNESAPPMVLYGDLHETCTSMVQKHGCVLHDRAPTAEDMAGERWERVFPLPDGKEITLGGDLLMEPAERVYFGGGELHKQQQQSSASPSSSLSLQQWIWNALQVCPIDSRKDMMTNICVVGGASLLPGFGDRLNRELTNLAAPQQRIRTVLVPERKYSVWIGASIMSSLGTFRDMWVSREEYFENF